VNPGVFAPNSQPYGKTYGEWGDEWHKWLLAIPIQESPLPDLTGEKCHMGQSGSVWFLAGTSGPPTAERTCTIPGGKALFFPIVNIFGVIPTDAETLAGLRSLVKDFIDHTTELTASVDGVALQGLRNYRCHSLSSFFYTAPEREEDTVFSPGYSGTKEAYADGFYLMLEPLAPGPHTITFHGRYQLPTTYPNVNEFSTTVTYHLTVE
jgi:hypothetical protein